MRIPKNPRPAKKTPKKPRPKKKKKTPKIRLLPVMDPRFNAREIIKQLCALEDHLNSSEKQCMDCIRKHFTTIEVFAEEAASLECAKYDCPDILKNLASTIRVLHHSIEHAAPAQRSVVIKDVKEKLRPIRKALMQKYAAIPLNKLPDNERAAIAAIHAACARKKKTSAPSSKTPRRRASPGGSRR